MSNNFRHITAIDDSPRTLKIRCTCKPSRFHHHILIQDKFAQLKTN